MRHGFLLLLIALSALVLVGCTQDSVNEFKEAQAELSTNPVAMDDILSADIIFCRRTGKKTGKVFGKSDAFTMKEKSSVSGVAQFENVEVGKTYAVHLVWLRPDMHEMFRYYAEVTVEQTESGTYLSEILRKKMADKHYLRQKQWESDSPSFQLSSKFNTSLGKVREPGTYTLRVYLHRELLLEREFELS